MIKKDCTIVGFVVFDVRKSADSWNWSNSKLMKSAMRRINDFYKINNGLQYCTHYFVCIYASLGFNVAENILHFDMRTVKLDV